MDPFWGVFRHIFTRTQNVRTSHVTCISGSGVISGVLSLGPKMDHFGAMDTLLERVFNKTRCSTQSLYARARIGGSVSGQIWLKWTPFRPLTYP